MSDSSLFGDDAPPAPAYRVLARKYRPGNFAGLIGQDAMVQTLANAIKRDRLAQAWLLTGVRGVGKTSTARIIARALNCVEGPTIEPCGVCEHCRQIASGSHMDVIEMDAASNTGVDDVREIIEAVRYASVSARYKIYIIDEVHMLSKSAFNALLKTLEEPPPHVKFIFATTEVQKLPVTVLSRCQRFDLRRVPAETLTRHFAEIAQAEQVNVELEALALIARAAEGSVRDGLSLLDQAIAHGGDEVTAAQVRDMLGLADRGAVRTLFGHCLAGDAPAMLAALAEQHALGRDPESLLRELLALVHGITRQRAAPAADPSLSAEEQAALSAWAERLDMGTLHRLWQLLLKGLGDVQTAPNPLQAAEMALLRLIHASTLPGPEELLKTLENRPETAPVSTRNAPEKSGNAPVSTLIPPDFPALVALFQQKTEPALAHLLSDELRVVHYDPAATPPELVLDAGPSARRDRLADIPRLLKEWTGLEWRVQFTQTGGGMTLHEAQTAEKSARADAARADPLVAALLTRFPDAELLGVEPTDERTPHAQSR
jgi:DNA polymerase-3 subunit gamma/tau